MIQPDIINRKRACIITFHSAYNFGAVLQAYALQEYISYYFGEARVLDYHNTRIDKSYSRPKLADMFHKPKQTFFRFTQSILYMQKNAKIDEFRNRYLKLTKRYDENDIYEANSEADVFITGSDQVWNYMIIGKDTNYFLDFVVPEKRTCSYAASIGVKYIPDDYIEKYKNAISKIQMISVRETAGIRTLADIGIDKVEVMPDPTLLLPKEVWEKLSIMPVIKGKYILVYKITKADQLIRFAKDLAKKTGLPIIYIPNDLKSGIVGSLKLSVGPREWLGYIHNAEYVVTNSFHGTVFSILFGKKFFAEVSDKVNPSTSRLMTLLSMFGFEDRIINRFNDELLGKVLQNDRITEVLREQQFRAHTFFEEIYKGDK